MWRRHGYVSEISTQFDKQCHSNHGVDKIGLDSVANTATEAAGVAEADGSSITLLLKDCGVVSGLTPRGDNSKQSTVAFSTVDIRSDELRTIMMRVAECSASFEHLTTLSCITPQVPKSSYMARLGDNDLVAYHHVLHDILHSLAGLGALATLLNPKYIMHPESLSTQNEMRARNQLRSLEAVPELVERLNQEVHRLHKVSLTENQVPIVMTLPERHSLSPTASLPTSVPPIESTMQPQPVPVPTVSNLRAHTKSAIAVNFTQPELSILQSNDFDDEWQF